MTRRQQYADLITAQVDRISRSTGVPIGLLGISAAEAAGALRRLAETRRRLRSRERRRARAQWPLWDDYRALDR
jgi:hypothetical protein